jgi:proteasome-associated ATPase
VEQLLSDEKLMIKTAGDESILVSRAEPLMKTRILVGDHVEYDPDSLFVYSLLPKTRVDHLALEKVPDISYADIGGLPEAIEQIRDAIELPHIYPEYFEEHQLVPPKGILLYGPPGCGKTLIAKAVANSLARRIEEKTGEKGESFFLNVKGPELLNKYVGETEQAIRDLFARARNQATYRTPVVIFFDEMDSMFRVRGSGISSDMESTIVPQFLAELDGLQSLENVVIIGATNREDLIDPAVLRPGRLDRKIRIPRPDRQAAVEIFSKYLTPDLPIDSCHTETLGSSEAAVNWLIEEAVEELYSLSPHNEIMEITFASGGRKVLYAKDLNSGAIIENIVRRAKFQAVKDLVRTGRKGITRTHLISALHAEFKESEDLPSNSNPAEWYRIIGKGSERVVRIVPLQGKTPEAEIIETQTVNVPEKLK